MDAPRPPGPGAHPVSNSVSRAGGTLVFPQRPCRSMTGRTSVKELVVEARKEVENLTVAEMTRELGRPDALLVDLREPAERAEHGTIPGALAAPRGMLEFYADPAMPYHKKELDPSRRVLLYCASGGRSALAGATLRRMGFPRVAHLDGGFKAWKDAGGEVVAAQA